jgi:hypothetical protein
MTSPDTTPDTSDPGDETAARLNYQYCYTAISAVRLVTDQECTVEVFCEHHEDFLVKLASGKFRGIQIKTRSVNLKTLKAKDEQVKKALRKFCVLDSKFPSSFESFSLITNHAFWEENESENNLPWLLASLRKRGKISGLNKNNPLRKFVEDIASSENLGVDEVIRTLTKVCLRGHKTGIDHIRGELRDVVSECPGVANLPYMTVVKIAEEVVD